MNLWNFMARVYIWITALAFPTFHLKICLKIVDQGSFCAWASQWAMALHCNAIYHWLGPCTEWSLVDLQNVLCLPVTLTQRFPLEWSFQSFHLHRMKLCQYYCLAPGRAQCCGDSAASPLSRLSICSYQAGRWQWGAESLHNHPRVPSFCSPSHTHVLPPYELPPLKDVLHFSFSFWVYAKSGVCWCSYLGFAWWKQSPEVQTKVLQHGCTSLLRQQGTDMQQKSLTQWCCRGHTSHRIVSPAWMPGQLCEYESRNHNWWRFHPHAQRQKS